MSATSLKLSKELKQRVSELVDGTNRTAHAFMIEAIEQVTQQEELRRRFGAEAHAAEQEAERTGKVYDARQAFTYLEARTRGVAAKKTKDENMATLRLSRNAFDNLQRIADFLIEHESTRAPQVMQRIREAILILENHPLMGRAVEDGRRELVISHGRNTYLALYRWLPVDNTVLILAIRDAREVGYRQE